MDWKKRLGEIKPTPPKSNPPSEKTSLDATASKKEARTTQEPKLSHLLVEDAETVLPAYFQGSDGERVLEEIKHWLSTIIPEKKTVYLDERKIFMTIPEALKGKERYFSGRSEAQNFEAMFRNHVVTKLRFAVGTPKEPTEMEPGMYLVPEDRNRCVFLVAGFYEGENSLFYRSFLIRNDGKVRVQPTDAVSTK